MMMMLHQPTTERHKKIMLQHTSNGGGRRMTSVTSPATVYLAAVVVIVLTTTCSSCEGSPCQPLQWWDPFQDKCIPCTECKDQKIVLRPCQLHRDAICGSIYDLEIDWMLLAKTEPNWKERRKEKILLLENENSHNQEENLGIDWQLMSLILVVLACLVFFIAAACILIQHLRQWRRMERRLDKDVEELSAKLMARLAEVQSLEGGTFYIEDASSIKIQNVRPQQMLLIGEKHTIKPTQPGNVYIEEASSKG